MDVCTSKMFGLMWSARPRFIGNCSRPQTDINAMILPKLKVEEVKTAAKPATDGPAASSVSANRQPSPPYRVRAW